MQLKRYGPNMAEISAGDGTRILFSYDEPVAAFLGASRVWVKTAKFFSRTTAAHVAKWQRENGAAGLARAVPHDELRALAASAGP